MRPYTSQISSRQDLSFSTNDDKPLGWVWLKSDGETPVVVASAHLTFELDDAEPTAEPPLPATVYEFDADPDGFALGQVLFVVPHTVWNGTTRTTGNWDLVAVSDTGLQRCLKRGTFVVTDAVSS